MIETEPLHKILEARHAVRESLLKEVRLGIQNCSKAIKLVHRRETDAARVLIVETKLLLQTTRERAGFHPQVLYSGPFQDAEKELAEAAVLLAMVSGGEWPPPEDLGIDIVPYLNGVGEAASELRRNILDLIRTGDTERAATLFDAMESAYDKLTSFDFPDSLTGGLRRTCDALRAVLERTRSDLTLTTVQSEMVRRIEAAARKN